MEIFNPELDVVQLRDLLESRLDDLDTGSVTPIEGEEAFRLLLERTNAQRRKRTA